MPTPLNDVSGTADHNMRAAGLRADLRSAAHRDASK